MNNVVKIPENTDLKLVFDGRSGAALEIIIPVLNEEKRIGTILKYYKNFDVVLLDGGSSDRTIEMAELHGATVFRRVGEAIGENHFTFYANTLSKSGYCFYMMADEYISKQDLSEAYAQLKKINAVVGVRKVEWIYGEEPAIIRKSNLGMARGFRSGTAAWDPYKIHNSLLYASDCELPEKMVVYDLHHLHIKDVKNEYGKMGRYLNIEVAQMMQSGAKFGVYFRRFAVPFLVQLVWRVWFNKTSFPHKMFKLAEMATAMMLAFMSWLELKFMPTFDGQLTQYKSKYK